MSEGPDTVPRIRTKSYSTVGFRWVPRRTMWLVLGAIFAAGVVVAAAFVLSSHGAQALLPVAWQLPDRCYGNCQYASGEGVLYTLMYLNQPSGLTEDLATYLSLQAYNWSSGAVLWSVANFSVWGLWPPWSHPHLFVNNGTVGVVLAANGEWVPGQPGPPVWFGGEASTFVFEWNASTGVLLNETHYGMYAGETGFWSASESQGWIAVADVENGPSGALIQSIPTTVHPGAHREWNTTVDPGGLPTSWCGPGVHVLQAGGTVSLWVSGNQSQVTVLSAATGTVLWQGEVPGWSSMETDTVGCQPESLTAGVSGVYYIDGSGSSAAITLLDPATHAATTVTNLSNTNATSDALNLLPDGELVVTDTVHDAYSAFSSTGTHLWTLALDITKEADDSGLDVWGTVVQPVELGPDSIFVSMAVGNGVPSSAEIGLPMEILNDSSGALSWQSSYVSWECGTPCASWPPDYQPMIGSGTGPYLLFELYSGNSASVFVARFA